MSNVSRQMLGRPLFVFRMGAIVGLVVSACLAPIALFGLYASISNVLVSFSSPYFWAFVPAHLWVFGTAAGGLLGFLGFAMASFTPWRKLSQCSRVRRVAVSLLGSGVIAAIAYVVPVIGATRSAEDWTLPAALLSLSLLASTLVWRLLNPHAERSSQGPLRAPCAAAHVAR